MTARKCEQNVDYFGKQKLRKIKLLLHAWKIHYVGKLQTSANYQHYYIHKFHGSMCVTKATGCGTSHTYTIIHNFYGAKYNRHFKKQYYKSSLHIKKFMHKVKGVCI